MTPFTSPHQQEASTAGVTGAAEDAAAELREAARLFHNLTQGDPEVIIRPPSAEKRDAIVAAGERLRAAITGANGTAPAAGASAYTDAIGQAGEDYLKQFPHAHPLPAQWRWSDLWDRMNAAAGVLGTPESKENDLG
jgi:hypothetical protein